MSNIYHQKTALQAVFYTRDGSLVSTDFGEHGDIINGSISKSVKQPAGGFSVTLVPRYPYFDIIHAGDWVKLFLDDGSTEPGEPYMVGNVDEVKRQRTVDQKGALVETVMVSGRDFGKVLMGCQTVYDPVMANPDTVRALVDFLGAFVSKQQDKKYPTVAPSELILKIIDDLFRPREQYLPPGSVIAYSDTDTSVAVPKQFGLQVFVSETIGHLMSNTNLDLRGNVWGMLKSYSHELLNELFVDTIRGEPTLVLREYPFSKDKFSALTSAALRSDETNGETLSYGESDVRNWFRVHPDVAGSQSLEVNSAIAKVGYINPASVERNGLRRMAAGTQYWGDTSGMFNVNKSGDVSGLMQEMSGKLAEWHSLNDEKLYGSFNSRMRADAHIGTRLDYTNERTDERLSFYVEGVSHNFQYPGASSTSWTVSRGVASDLSALWSLQELVDDFVVFPLERFSTAKNSGSTTAYKSDTTRVVDTPTATLSAAQAPAEPVADTMTFAWPTVSHNITSQYKTPHRPTHAGIDIGIVVGTDVMAAADGTVIRASTTGGYGYAVFIQHADGYVSVYGHLSDFHGTKVGTMMLEGATIGKSGGAIGAVGAGTSTGPHLHFEIRHNSTTVDPQKVLR